MKASTAMNIVENHSQSPHESLEPPNFILNLRRNWFLLSCSFMQAVEAHQTPADAMRFCREIDAILKAFETLKAQVRRGVA